MPGLVKHKLRRVDGAVVHEFRHRVRTDTNDVIHPWRLSRWPKIGPGDYARVSIWFGVEDIVGPLYRYGVRVQIQDILKRREEQSGCYTLILIGKDARCVFDMIREKAACNPFPSQLFTPPRLCGGFVHVPEFHRKSAAEQAQHPQTCGGILVLSISSHRYYSTAFVEIGGRLIGKMRDQVCVDGA